jgi:hypothetical protein
MLGAGIGHLLRCEWRVSQAKFLIRWKFSFLNLGKTLWNMMCCMASETELSWFFLRMSTRIVDQENNVVTLELDLPCKPCVFYCVLLFTIIL